jgi:surfactin synthase thioesterase subunit
VALKEQTVESLRKSPEFQQALADFNASQNELSFVSQLMDLVVPILQSRLK